MAKQGKSVTTIRHKDKRANIPTQELRGFMEEGEKSPTILRYPRDPSLDPQLVWRGKDEQDGEDLTVPSVPIYIQEKIHPKAIIDTLRTEAVKGTEPMADLFADFNNIAFQDLIEFYQHEQNWSNRLILGDSLLVMTSLAEKEELRGKVQMIYMDPPYGIKFGSNWQVSTRKRDVKDGKVEDATREPEVIKAFRDTWALGIHSYLTYLRDRFAVARDLMHDTGSIFVQIGRENVHLVRGVMDEIFGAENFCSLITFVKTSGQTDKLLASVSDYLLWYGKDRKQVKYVQLYADKIAGGEGGTAYQKIELESGYRRTLTRDEKANLSKLPAKSRLFRLDNLTSQSPGTKYPIAYEGRTFEPKGYWKTEQALMPRLLMADRVAATDGGLYYVRYFDDFTAFPVNDNWTDTGIAGFASEKRYVVETSTKVVERCLLMTTSPGDLVLDPTCGSGTTAFVAEHWGRRWITVDASRVALALARTRLIAGRFDYFLLADSAEGIQKEAEISGRVPPEHKTDHDIRKGFVYRRVPHIALKSIANNPEIDIIHKKWLPKIDAGREAINKATSKSYADWEIPHEAENSWTDMGKKALVDWWQIRRQRKQEIDASIAKNADRETMFDEPYADPKRIRVSGPFTVESLSPHRVLPADDDLDAEVSPQEAQSHGDLITTLLDNLRKAGVQNTKKSERLKFTRLEPYAGTWLQADGEFEDASGATKRVAVCFGPEHGAVGPDLIREAAKEAVQGIGWDILLVCGFAFDPHASEEAARYKKPVVLVTRMNPDLTMGDELLKKTGAGNLFMVFGEPDIAPLDPKTGKIKAGKDGKIAVEIRGVDVYDPTTGQIRSNATDDIACWFIDTDYNGESFFVRRAYFTGGDKPFERLQKSLRAEINEDAWATLYSTKSRPFDHPKSGKIAIKVINHYGDEVLKVYEVA